MTGGLQTFILKKSLREGDFIQKRLITSLLLVLLQRFSPLLLFDNFVMYTQLVNW